MIRTRHAGALVLIAALSACISVPTSSASVGSGEPSPSASAPTSSGSHPLAGEDAWIAYQTNKGDGVWLIHPDGKDDHEVVLDVPGEHLHPDWSPDGTRIVITSREAKDTLYELDLATDEARPVGVR